MTKASDYIAREILKLDLPIVTIDEIESIIHTMYSPQSRKGLFLRCEAPDINDIKRYVYQLLKNKDLKSTKRKGVFYVKGQDPLSTQEMVSLADSHIYVAYLSAMQRWGLTNRQAKDFIFARPNRAIIKSLKANKDEPVKGKWGFAETPIQLAVSPKSLSQILEGHRKKNIQIVETSTPAKTMLLGGEHTRISTQAATFVDMLYRPDLCGGMSHISEVWEEHIPLLGESILRQLIETVDAATSPILKVRAGYLLSEKIGLRDSRVDTWKKFAARGGSRKLDPDKPYINEFSEDWMLSLNV